MSRIIDISVTSHSSMPQWPGGSGFHLSRTQRMEDGSANNVSRLDTDVHCGTHVDAPLHFVEGGGTVEHLALHTLIGPALVVNLSDCDVITRDLLEASGIPAGTERVLFQTRNSRLWSDPDQSFREDFVALAPDAAGWVVERGIRLVGVDYLSVQRFHDGPETHQILLQAGVVILESLNLEAVVPGSYELICLPIKLADAEGAPARALLKTLD